MQQDQRTTFDGPTRQVPAAAPGHDQTEQIELTAPDMPCAARLDQGLALAKQVRAWCAENGQSMRALSLQLGKGPKYVADIAGGKSRNPDPAALRELAGLTGLQLCSDVRPDPKRVVRAGVYFDTVLDLIEASDLSAKAAICRDVRLVCREWLKREPNAVPADAYWLRQQMSAWNGARFGISTKRFANIKSHLNKALTLSGAVVSDRKPVLAVGEPWRQLWAAIPDEPVIERRTGSLKLGRGGVPKSRRHWIAPPLSGLLRFCDRDGIQPDDVDADVLDAYAKERDTLSINGFGAKKLKDLRYAWNKAIELVPGWPQRPIAGPKPTLLNLPLTAFPSSLRDDLESYRAEKGCRGSQALAKARLLDRARALYRSRRSGADHKPGRLLATLADTTLFHHLDALRFTASVMVRNGLKRPKEINSIADVAAITSAAAAVDDIEQRLGLQTSYAGNIVKVLSSIAIRWRDDLTDGELDDFAALRAEAESSVETGRMSDRDRQRLAVFMDPVMMQRLVLLPIDIVEAAEQRRRRGAPVTVAQALEVQSAVMCVIEQTLVPRLATLALTHLDRHIIWPHRKNGPGQLSYSSADTKTDTPLLGQLLPWKIEVLNCYLQHYRPVLANGAEDRWLFPGDSAARSKSTGAIAQQMRELLFTRLGVRINFHLWRKIMGSWLLKITRDPDLVGALLGHKDGSTVTRLYAEFQTAWAVEALDGTVEQLLDRQADVGSLVRQAGRR